MEQLDHRQLLSVNFTGNVPIDFPASTVPGVVVLPFGGNSTFAPITNPPLAAVMHNVTGWDITAIRVTYTPSDDTLSIGLEGPPSGNPSGGQVIAGDADNNGNSGTVNPIISNPTPPPNGLAQGFMDPPDFGGTEHMGAFLDFTGSGNAQNAQIVAGF